MPPGWLGLLGSFGILVDVIGPTAVNFWTPPQIQCMMNILTAAPRQSGERGDVHSQVISGLCKCLEFGANIWVYQAPITP